jgi:hypothetical protein
MSGYSPLRTPLLLAAFWSASVLSFSQSPEKLHSAKFPSMAGDEKAFVPDGWMIEEKITGDVNADSIPDTVLKLIEVGWEKDERQENVKNEGERIMLVLLGTGDGRLRPVGFSDKLLQCGSCGGAFYGVMKAPANVSLQKGAIIVEQDYGSRVLSAWTFRLRYDAKLQKVMLIGIDWHSTDRATGESLSISENLLTGRRLTEKSQYDQKKDRHVAFSKKPGRALLKPMSLEQIDFLRLQGKFEQ